MILLPNDELDLLCRGLKQNAAKARFLREEGYTVMTSPDGTPNVTLESFQRKHGIKKITKPANEPNSAAILSLFGKKAA